MTVAGVAAVVVLAAWAKQSDAGRVALRLSAFFIIGAFVLERIYEGWCDDGMVGVWYRWRHPMGSMLASDDERSPIIIAWAVVGASAITAILIVNKGRVW